SRNGQLAASTDPHARDALVPAGDDLPGTEPEAERRVPRPRRVELVAVRVRDADVMDGDLLARASLGTLADHDVVDHQVGRWWAGGYLDIWLGLSHTAHPMPARERPPPDFGHLECDVHAARVRSCASPSKPRRNTPNGPTCSRFSARQTA